MYEKRCGNCQSLYRIIEQKVSFRDSHYLECKICGTELHRWNCAVDYRSELIESKASHSSEIHQDSKPEVCPELLEDLAIAKEADEEYDRQGLEGTIPYTEYRTKRLGSESSL